MIKNDLTPDYIFETSWEVCNKVGGIHTVLSTRANTLQNEIEGTVVFIGPELGQGENIFQEDKKLLPKWRTASAKVGLNVRIGRWNVPSQPIAVLVDFPEDMPTNPLGVYGKSKLHGEQAITEVGAKAIIIRTAWLYSEFGNNFLKTMLRLTAEKENLNVVFDQVGTPTYAGDLALAIFSIIEGDYYAGNEGIYHFSNEGVCSWYDFAQEIATAMRHDKCKIHPCHSNEFPSKVTRPSFSVLDKTKIKKTFGIDIPHWRESMIYCLKRIVMQQQAN